MTPEITVGEILANSPQYVTLLIAFWAIAKLGPVLIKLAVQIEKMNDLAKRMLKKLEEK